MRGVFPAVTTKFTTEGEFDKAEMERRFAFEAGADGMIVCGSPGENMTLDAEEVAGGKRPTLPAL
ncbi:4-hydroxy-tetrahydrodipicolinate synthase [Ensifer psoraleae]|nr:4-hydroxy-tetrahydrodipicolinate synthase [Sinorhizobium psoraleae]